MNIGKLVEGFFNSEIHKIQISEDNLSSIFSLNEEASHANSQLFGAINRALRKHCIHVSELITMMKQYNSIIAILSAWYHYHDTLQLFALQISEIFGKKQQNDVYILEKVVRQQIKQLILNFGYRNWKRYVLDAGIIYEETHSFLEIISGNLDDIKPEAYPFNEKDFISYSKKLIGMIPEENFTERDYAFARFIGTFIHNFVKHPALYPKDIKNDLTECAMIANTLFCLMKHNIDLFKTAKEKLISKLIYLDRFFQEQKSDKQNTYTFFNNYEYISLLKMVCLCNTDYYIKFIIPKQIEFFSKIKKQRGSNSELRALLDVIIKYMLPFYETAMKIIEDNKEAVLSFASQFCANIIPIDMLTKFSQLFSEEKYIHCMWTIFEYLPQYLIYFQDSFIEYFKQNLNKLIQQKEEQLIQETVGMINSLVEGEFHHHPTMVLARTKILIPHQKDSTLVDRALILVQQAQIPSLKDISINELFDIVSIVKNKKGLFTGIGKFLQDQLLSEVRPSVELEINLLDSMGQITETEFIKPIQFLVRDFSKRYEDFEKIKEKVDFPPIMSVAVLDVARWEKVVQRGNLSFFNSFQSFKDSFEVEYQKLHENRHLFWCDPSSVIEIKFIINGKDTLFLFNGVQYSIVSMLLSNSYCDESDMVAQIQVDDLTDQLSTLVEVGLVKKHPNKTDAYYLTNELDSTLNRNFAKMYTSAENNALIKMKEFDHRKAINCMICKLLKKKGAMTMKDIAKTVEEKAVRYFNINQEIIIQQARELEITKYIVKGESDKFKYNPE